MNIKRFSISYTPADGEKAIVSVFYEDLSTALSAYLQVSDEFCALSPPAGASLSLNDQHFEFQGGIISKGLGVMRHVWFKESTRSRLDTLLPHVAWRTELSPFRVIFYAWRTAKESIENINVVEQPATRRAAGLSNDRIQMASVEKERVVTWFHKPSFETEGRLHYGDDLGVVISEKSKRLHLPNDDSRIVEKMPGISADDDVGTISLSDTTSLKHETWFRLSPLEVKESFPPTQLGKKQLVEVVNDDGNIALPCPTNSSPKVKTKTPVHINIEQQLVASGIDLVLQEAVSNAARSERVNPMVQHKIAEKILPISPKVVNRYEIRKLVPSNGPKHVAQRDLWR